MKRFILAASIFVFGLSLAGESRAQFCGGSTRTIELKFPSAGDAKVRVEYELFLLFQKNEDGYDIDQKAFLSEFMDGNPDVLDFRLLRANRRDDTFIEAEKGKAENYVKTYDPNDLEDSYSGSRISHYRSQMQGKFDDGILKLHTSEMDDTVFLMKVSAVGYETQYLVSTFLGGCFGPDSRHPQKIFMRLAPIEPKCLIPINPGDETTGFGVTDIDKSN